MAAAIPEDIQAVLDSAVASGRYGSGEEALREAIALLQERDDARKARVEAFVAEVAEGQRAAAEGRSQYISREEMKRLAREGYESRKG